jgi:hypothetical protein
VNVNLQELINQPGAGKANAALKKEGLWDEWDEWAGMKEKEWDVTVSGVIYKTKKYEVTARCEEEAMEKAEEMACSDFDDDINAEEAIECN